MFIDLLSLLLILLILLAIAIACTVDLANPQVRFNQLLQSRHLGFFRVCEGRGCRPDQSERSGQGAE